MKKVIDYEEIRACLRDRKYLKHGIKVYDSMEYKEQHDLICSLFDGDLDNINYPDLNLLIASGIYFDDEGILKSSINACNKLKQYDVLYYIVNHICSEYKEPTTDQITSNKELKRHILRAGDYSADMESRVYSFLELVDERNRQKKKIFERLFRDIAVSSAYNQNYELFKIYKDIDIETFRIYLSGFTDKPEEFLNDNNKRVEKIANLRVNIDNEISNKPIYEQRIIAYITNLLNEKIITRFNGGIISYDKFGNYTNELVCAGFGSIDGTLFSDWLYDFDNDIFNNIVDERVLASYMIDYIKEGKFYIHNIPLEYVEDFKQLKNNNKKLKINQKTTL